MDLINSKELQEIKVLKQTIGLREEQISMREKDIRWLKDEINTHKLRIEKLEEEIKTSGNMDIIKKIQ